jgi:hypothetical protein
VLAGLKSLAFKVSTEERSIVRRFISFRDFDWLLLGLVLLLSVISIF